MANLTNSVSEKIKRAAIDAYPNEACGLVVKVGRKTVAIVCENTSSDPQNRFVIAPKEFADAEDMGEVIGVWHTHVDKSSNPSEADIYGCNASALHWYIFDIYKTTTGFKFGSVAHLSPSSEDLPYEGRPYIYGLNDCFTLSRDYYEREFGLKVDFRAPGYPESEDWHARGENLLADNYERAGFLKLIDKDAEAGDLFLIQLSSDVANHIAIYIGDGKMLHHCRGRLSTIDVYGGYWLKHTVFHLRHKSRVTS